MSDRTSFDKVYRAVLAVDALQQQVADLAEAVRRLTERLEALEVAMSRRD